AVVIAGLMIWNAQSAREKHVDRRLLLRGLGVGAASLAASRAFAQSDDPLQQLIQQNQRGGLGVSFDSTSRTIAMPKASLPTLSPPTVPPPEVSGSRCENNATEGGGPMVPVNDRLRVGVRHPAVLPLRARLK